MLSKQEVLQKKHKKIIVIESPQKNRSVDRKKKQATQWALPSAEPKIVDLNSAAKEQASTVLGIAPKQTEGLSDKTQQAETVLTTFGSQLMKLDTRLNFGSNRGTKQSPPPTFRNGKPVDGGTGPGDES